jgi:hypothetical protein
LLKVTCLYADMKSTKFTPRWASITGSLGNKPSDRRIDSSHRQFLSFDLLC